MPSHFSPPHALVRAARSRRAKFVALALLVPALGGCGKSGATIRTDTSPAQALRESAATAPGTAGAGAGQSAGAGAGKGAGAGAGAGASKVAGASDPQATHNSQGGSPPRSGKPGSVPPAHPVPAAFRPAAGAPSDAEVRQELEQLSTIQRQERERALSAAAANLAGLLPWSLEQKSGTQISVASVFRDYGLGLACGGVLGRQQLGVAHKTAPCGTLITFTYAGRSITVPVIDRGPYIAGREWDLTGATAEALGFPGLGQIAWSVAG